MPSLVELAKSAREKDDAKSSALVGAGAVTAAAGLVGGGIPGVKSDADTIKNIRRGKWKQRVGAGAASGRGGIFGYRTDAHQQTLDDFRARREAEKKWVDPDRPGRFNRAITAGKVQPEAEVIRHLKRGRVASNVALGAGVAATAYGVKRMKDADASRSKQRVSKTKSDADRYNGLLMGAGAATAVGADLGARAADGQARKWKSREKRSLDRAQMHAERLETGMKSSDAAARHGEIFEGKTNEAVEAAGRHRGAASQERYFSNVYRSTAKVARKVRAPAAAVAGITAGSLALSNRQKPKPPVKQKVRKAAPDLKDMRVKDDRYDDIEARKRRLTSLPKAAYYAKYGDLPSAAVHAGKVLKPNESRGQVALESRKPHRNKALAAVGGRERSMVAPGHAKKGQEEAKFGVAPRSDKERRRDRVDQAARVAIPGAVATGALGYVGPRLSESAADKMTEDSSRAVRRRGRALKVIGKHPRKLAAAAGAATAAGAYAGWRREPDTHKVVFRP